MPPEVLAVPAAGAARLATQAPAHRSAGIAALGIALPPTVVSNAEVGARAGVDGEWILRRTGIRERRHLVGTERLDELAAAAGREALDRAGVPAERLDAVLVATSSADDLFPQAAPLVAGLLGAGQAMAWDVGLACTGFIAGLAQGAALIESGRAERVLLIGADALSRNADPAERGTASLFGDGAAAVVLVEGGGGRIAETTMGSDGAASGALTAARADGLIRMDGHEVFRHAIARMEQACREVLDHADLGLADVDLVVPHQANGRMTTALRERLGLPPDRVADDIAGRGNTSAATIPLALQAAADAGRLPTPGCVLLCAFGAGFAWGAALVHFGDDLALPLQPTTKRSTACPSP